MTDPAAIARAEERAAILRWIVRYGDEINRVISQTQEGPLRTAMMGEFSACATIRQGLLKGKHLDLNTASGGSGADG